MLTGVVVTTVKTASGISIPTVQRDVKVTKEVITLHIPLKDVIISILLHNILINKYLLYF